ncbi:MAG: hypothetical protein IT384_01465 [Deltaproteobacteria bacterium]|nr:hypothetical protein [Deltaproteobacteria bacterium]
MADKIAAEAAPANDRDLSGRAKDLAQDAGRELLEAANKKGQRGMSALGQQLEHAASFVSREAGEAAERGQLPIDREKVGAVTDRIQSAASYLRENDPKSMLEDVDTAIRKHPYRAMAIGLGIGWLIGRLSRSD